MRKDIRIKRGDIYLADLNPVIGSEQGNVRPVIIVQNNIGNAYSPTVIVVPTTGNRYKTDLPTHVLIPKASGLGVDSLALVEQIRTVDCSRLGALIGHIGADTMSGIDKALAICVGLERRRSPKGEMLELSLCGRCERSFRESGHVLIKKGWQRNKEKCDFCQSANGLTFGVINVDMLPTM